MKSSIVSLFFFPLLLVCADASLKSDGERLYIEHGCYGCHGSLGEGINGYPKLARKPIEYLARRLHDFKSGKAKGSRKEMMIPYARALSEKEIEALSAFLAFIPEETKESMEVPEEILGSDM